MGGSSKKSDKVAPVVAPTIDPFGYQGTGGYQQFQNQGYQPTPQTFTQAGRPAWMQGHFAMPEWGMRADAPNQQVTPDMLDPRTAMFAQRDAYNALMTGDPRMSSGSVQDALAQYAGQSSALQNRPVGAPVGPSQVPAMGGKGGLGMQMARGMANEMRSNPGDPFQVPQMGVPYPTQGGA